MTIGIGRAILPVRTTSTVGVADAILRIWAPIPPIGVGDAVRVVWIRVQIAVIAALAVIQLGTVEIIAVWVAERAGRLWHGRRSDIRISRIVSEILRFRTRAAGCYNGHHQQ